MYACRKHIPSPAQHRSEHSHAIKLAGRGSRADDACASRTMAEHIVMRLRIIYDTVRPLGYGNVTGNRLIAKGGVVGFDTAVNYRNLHAFAVASLPGPIFGDVLDRLHEAEGTE